MDRYDLRDRARAFWYRFADAFTAAAKTTLVAGVCVAVWLGLLWLTLLPLHLLGIASEPVVLLAGTGVTLFCAFLFFNLTD